VRKRGDTKRKLSKKPSGEKVSREAGGLHSYASQLNLSHFGH